MLDRVVWYKLTDAEATLKRQSTSTRLQSAIFYKAVIFKIRGNHSNRGNQSKDDDKGSLGIPHPVTSREEVRVGFHVKFSLFLPGFNQDWDSRQISVKRPVSNFAKIHSALLELLHADNGRTDV
jgi:hypothetical protein